MTRFRNILLQTLVLADFVYAQTVIFEEQFDGAGPGYNIDSTTALTGENDWVDFVNRITVNAAGNEGYFTAADGAETVLTGAANGNDPQIRSDFSVGIPKADVGRIEIRTRIDIDQNGTYDDSLTASHLSLFWGSNPYVEPGAANGNQHVSITFGQPDSVIAETNGWHLFVWNDDGGLTAGEPGSTMVNSLRIDPANNLAGSSFEIDRITIAESTLIKVDPSTPVPAEFSLRQEWNWNTDDDLEGWTAGGNNHFTINGVMDGLLSGTSTAGDAQLFSPEFLVPDVSTGRFIFEIGLVTDPGDTSSKRLFWGLDGNAFNATQAITFPPIPDDGNEHVVRLNLDDVINAPITRIRYDPSAAADFSSKINFIRIYSAGSQIVTGAPQITSFSYDSESGNAQISLRGKVSTVYNFFSDDDLDFSNGESIFILSASTGALDGSGVRTDEGGNATVELLMDGSPKKFVRAQE